MMTWPILQFNSLFSLGGDWLQSVSRIVSFGLVGLSGMVIDFGVTWLLKEKCSVNKYLASSTGFVLAVLNNYYWNRLFTFKSVNPMIGAEMLRFFLVALVGLGLNNLFIWIFNHRFHLAFYRAKILAIALVFIWNYLANLLITFS